MANLELLNLQHRLKYLEQVLREVYAAAQGSGLHEQPDLPRVRELCRWALGLDVPYHEPEWMGDVRDEKEREARMGGL